MWLMKNTAWKRSVKSAFYILFVCFCTVGIILSGITIHMKSLKSLVDLLYL